MKRSYIVLVGCVLLAGMVFAERVQNAGLYAIWVNSRDTDRVYSLPYITGGQTVVQWRDVEPSQGKYDFSDIDRSMEWFNKRGQKATLQINGNKKPLWLFDKVPYHPEKLSHQIGDDKGSLMFWHPVHRDAYLNVIKALAAHLDKSDYQDSVLGIRLNFNPFGTEHHTAKGNPDMSVGKWIVPKGVDHKTVTRYDKKVVEEYLRSVVDTYVSNFKGKIRVFVRNGVKEEVIGPYRSMFEDGTLSWFHTSSEAEPRASFAEEKYRRFFDDCRSGMTTAYAEPWASAWGHHGGKTDDRWCTPPQWMYWRLLNDLHCGVSFIAVYANNVQVAMDGTYRSTGVNYSDGKDGTYQEEFTQALEFAATYAGYHASPEDSPGAWIAFRENDTVLAANGVSAERRKLKFFNTDYTFLMERLPGDRSVGQGITNIGPDGQRFGAWARKLPAGKEIKLALNRNFAASLKGGAKIRVTFYDDGNGAFQLDAGTKESAVKMGGSKRWQTAEFPMVGKSPKITLSAGKSPLLLHMVEVVR
ncbi:MAG: beta-galactosidase [Kiritimatiellales bacterium]|nr:beta-galactosidase [Kiritimatiellales bacterium]